MTSMGLWILAFFLFFLGIQWIGQDQTILAGLTGFTQQKKALHRVAALLREIEETLGSGLVPSQQRWKALEALQEPWGVLTSESLQELRASGGSLLPTLRRLRGLAEEHTSAIENARAKSSQAFAQALACSLLAPSLGCALYAILPEIQNHLRAWMVANGLTLGVMGVGSLWLLQMASCARWGGLEAGHRSWVLCAQCSGERFLALVRAGTPPDLAWARSCDLLTLNANDLAVAWGHSIWETPSLSSKNLAEQTIISAGLSLKKAVQVSLMEGYPCTEKVEAVLFALRQDLQSQIDRELSLLSTRALKPLFLCVAPALLGLLFFGMWLGMSSTFEEARDVF